MLSPYSPHPFHSADGSSRSNTPEDTQPNEDNNEVPSTANDPPKTNCSLPVVSHRIPLSSSGSQHGEWEATTMQDDGITVDYIFYSTPKPRKRRGEPGLELKGYLAPVTGEEIEEAGGLPNEHHSSDHLPMFASFVIT